MFRFLKGHIEYLTQHLQPAKCIPKEQNVIKNLPPGKYAVGQKIKEFVISVQQAMS